MAKCLKCGLPVPPSTSGGCPNCLLGLAADERTDRLIGRYEIIQEIGKGASGTVFRVKGRALGDVLAVKVLNLRVSDLHSRGLRFLKEAEILAGLKHPNIVRILDYDLDCSQPWYAMDLFAGGSLAEQVSRQALDPRRAADVLRRIADAVQSAHDAGIVHRDIKPGNILLDEVGTPFLSDFGIARDIGENTGITVTNGVLGTPPFMSPEQARGDAVGKGSDIYSLGAVLYFCLVARPPFVRDSVHATLQSVIEDEPMAPSQLVPGLPRPLEIICLKCLSKNPAKRYTSAKALADDLGRFLNREPILARAVPQWVRGWLWMQRHPGWASAVGLGCLLLILSTVGIWQVSRRNTLIAQSSQQLRSQLIRQIIEGARQDAAAGRSAEALSGLAAVAKREPESRVVRENLLAHLVWWSFPELVHSVPSTEGRVKAAYHHPTEESLALILGAPQPVLQFWSPTQARRIGEPVELPGEVGLIEPLIDSPLVVVVCPQVGFRLWNVTNGLPATPWQGDSNILSAVVSPDRRFLLTFGSNAPASLWSLPEALLKRQFVELAPIRHAAFSPDSDRFCFSIDGNRVGSFNLEGQGRVGVMTELKEPAVQVLFESADSFFVLDRSQTLHRCSVDGGTPSSIRIEDLGNGPLIAAPDRSRLLVGGRGSTNMQQRMVTDLRSRLLALPSFEIPPFLSQPFSTDGGLLLVSRRMVNNEVHFLDSFLGLEWGKAIRLAGRHHHLSWVPGQYRVVVSLQDSDSSAQVWDVRDGAFRPEPLLTSAPDVPQRALLAGPTQSQRHLEVLYPDDQWVLWDVERRKPILGPWKARGLGRSVMAANAETLVFLPEGHPPELWSSTSGRWTRRALPGFAVTNLTWQLSGTGQYLLTCRSGAGPGLEGEIRDVGTLQEVSTWSLALPALGTGTTLTAYARFSDDGDRFAVGTSLGTMGVFDSRSGKQVGDEVALPAPISDLRFDSSGAHLAVASQDSIVRVFRMGAGASLAAQLFHPSSVKTCEWLPNGHLLAVGTDGGVSVWNPREESLLGRTSPAVSWPAWVSVSADGQRFLVSQSRGPMQIYDSQTCLPIGPAFENQGSFAALSNDGSSMVTVATNGLISAWGVPIAPEPLPAGFIEMAEALAGRRQAVNGVLQSVAADGAHKARSRLATVASNSVYGPLAAWLVSDRDGRKSNPGSRLSRKEEALARMDNAGLDANRVAARLLVQDPRVIGQLAVALVQRRKANQFLEARFHAARALRLDPHQLEAGVALSAADRFDQDRLASARPNISKSPKNRTALPVPVPPTTPPPGQTILLSYRIRIDPAATYLYADPKAPAALPISLQSMRISPGDWITIRPVGTASMGNAEDERELPLIAAFSRSAVVLPKKGKPGLRLPGIVPAGQPEFVTQVVDGNRFTDISGDFLCQGQPVQVPPEAAFLFTTTTGNHYEDNFDADGDFFVEIGVLGPAGSASSTPEKGARK